MKIIYSHGIKIQLLQGFENDIWASNHHPVKQPKNRKIIITNEDMSAEEYDYYEKL